ncbi:MAG: trypsin-like serine protease, partial [Dehalococcoidia bacterium]
LYVQDQQDNWIVVGITSWGYGCGWPGAPDVYTRVTAIASWIQSVSGVVPGSYSPATPTSAPTRDPSLHYLSVSGAISHELVVAPTPTATKPTGIYLQNATFYTTPGGLLYVVGELVNGLNHTVEFVQITSTFYNHNGGVIASRIGLPEITTIPAGGDSPFAVIYFGDLSQVAAFTLQVTRYSATPLFPVVTGLEATVTEISVDFLGNIHVKGTITNTGNKTWKLVQPLAAFYEPGGLVVRVKSTITFPAQLLPGQTGVFDIFTDDPGNIDTFRIWIDGSQ